MPSCDRNCTSTSSNAGVISARPLSNLVVGVQQPPTTPPPPTFCSCRKLACQVTSFPSSPLIVSIPIRFPTVCDLFLLFTRHPAPLPSWPERAMTMARPVHRASSTASSTTSDYGDTSPAPPLPPRLGRSSSNPASATTTPLTPYHEVHTTAHAARSKHRRSRTDLSQPSPPPVHPSLLQPRVAVVLNVPQPWHPWLFALRLCSVLPALWWGLPCALQLLLRLLPGEDKILVVRPKRSCITGTCEDLAGSDDAVSFALTEAALATIWVRISLYIVLGNLFTLLPAIGKIASFD